MNRITEIAFDSFLDGFTGAGLFGLLRRPGAPTEFVDSRTVQEIRESGEFAEKPLNSNAANKMPALAEVLVKAGSRR